MTGGGRGIGRAIGLELAQAGYPVVIDYVRDRRSALDTRRRILAGGGTAEVRRADVSRRNDRNRLVSFALERFGRIEILVNNAGVAPERRDDLLEAGEESFDRVLSVNLKGPYFLTQRVAREMVRELRGRAAPDRYEPKIITISSVSAFIASPERGEYCVSKAGLSMMTRLFAARLAPEGIPVFEVQPGIIRTDMTEPVRRKYDARIRGGLVPMERWGRPEDVARVVRVLAVGEVPYSTGETIRIDGGLHLRVL